MDGGGTNRIELNLCTRCKLFVLGVIYLYGSHSDSINSEEVIFVSVALMSSTCVGNYSTLSTDTGWGPCFQAYLASVCTDTNCCCHD